MFRIVAIAAYASLSLCVAEDCHSEECILEAPQSVELLQKQLELQNNPMEVESPEEEAAELKEEAEMERAIKDAQTIEVSLGSGVDFIVPSKEANLINQLNAFNTTSKDASLLQSKTGLCQELYFPTHPAPGYICGPRSERIHVDAWTTESACEAYCTVLANVGCSYYWRSNPSLARTNFGWCRCCKDDAKWFTSANPWTARSCCIR
eukprot:TRINITY_DN63426_c0_g1_i1.p1 TRINITY_DN63426_c0_g1~~TRINITY_DN63426_c0_g1_i1.p1  ORF type:complete len:227 (-),score=40.06 TRINITY_DN63426_c0_g1_i1:108-728(-)